VSKVFNLVVNFIELYLHIDLLFVYEVLDDTQGILCIVIEKQVNLVIGNILKGLPHQLEVEILNAILANHELWKT